MKLIKLQLFLGPTRAPNDADKLNHFAALYNEYIAKLHEGNLDIGAWRKAQKAYEDLE